MSYEQLAGHYAKNAMLKSGRKVTYGPIVLDFCTWRKIPSSWSLKDKAAALAGEIVPSVKPDIDNFIKIICDALNGIVWIDDKQVVQVNAAKLYSDNPRTDITVSTR